MIKNGLLGLLVGGLVGGCQGAPPAPAGYQGVVEYEARSLSFEVPGKLTKVAAARGDIVHAGAELATLDDELARLTVEASQEDAAAAQSQTKVVKQGARPEEIRAMTSQVAAAKALEDQVANNLARTERLVAGGARPPSAADDLRSEFERAKQTRMALEQQLAALRSGARAPEVATAQARAAAAAAAARLAQTRLSKYKLVADADAYVLEAPVKVGEVVGTGAAIFTVADTTKPYADVFVPMTAIGSFRVGAKAQLRVDTQAVPFSAHVEQIGQQTEFTPRFVFSERERANLMYRVRVRIDDPERQLHAGLPAFMTLAAGQ